VDAFMFEIGVIVPRIRRKRKITITPWSEVWI